MGGVQPPLSGCLVLSAGVWFRLTRWFRWNRFHLVLLRPDCVHSQLFMWLLWVAGGPGRAILQCLRSTVVPRLLGG